MSWNNNCRNYYFSSDAQENVWRPNYFFERYATDGLKNALLQLFNGQGRNLKIARYCKLLENLTRIAPNAAHRCRPNNGIPYPAICNLFNVDGNIDQASAIYAVPERAINARGEDAEFVLLLRSGQNYFDPAILNRRVEFEEIEFLHHNYIKIRANTIRELWFRTLLNARFQNDQFTHHRFGMNIRPREQLQCIVPRDTANNTRIIGLTGTIPLTPRAMQAKNTIIYGPPGTGKTHSVTSLVLDTLLAGEDRDFCDDTVTYANGVRSGRILDNIPDADWRKWIEKYNELAKEGRIEFSTFHQNYAYEDFIEGLRASINDESNNKASTKANNKANSNTITYKIEGGVLKRIAYRALFAWITGENPPKREMAEDEIKEVLAWLKDPKDPPLERTQRASKYVLVIDEINRGNVARIFGELITLVEDSKRACRAEDITSGKQPLMATLPYSKEPFILPPNLYIIGTMNTADRSLIGLDAALRRRFDFIEMRPQCHLLRRVVVDGVNLETMLEVINQRIENLGYPEHAIGHAYLMNVRSIDDLANAMRRKVIPQLREYFHSRPEIIQEVLALNGGGSTSVFVDIRGRQIGSNLQNNDPFGVAGNYINLYPAQAQAQNPAAPV